MGVVSWLLLISSCTKRSGWCTSYPLAASVGCCRDTRASSGYRGTTDPRPTGFGTPKSPDLSVSIVGFLSDSVVQGEIDDLLASAATPSSRLMSRLVSLGWRPYDGEVPALLYGMALFVRAYNEQRDLGCEIENSLDLAYATTLNHPVISKLVAAKTGAALDAAAGVE